MYDLKKCGLLVFTILNGKINTIDELIGELKIRMNYHKKAKIFFFVATLLTIGLQIIKIMENSSESKNYEILLRVRDFIILIIN